MYSGAERLEIIKQADIRSERLRKYQDPEAVCLVIAEQFRPLDLDLYE